MSSLFKNFLGSSPDWYKYLILIFMCVNPVLFHYSPMLSGWALVIEFIFTLAMALTCYPLLPGGLLAIEAVGLGMTDSHNVFHELVANFEVISLLMFMVAGIYFLKDLLFEQFSKLFLRVHSKALLSVSFMVASAFLSAFLDALTVIAVVLTVLFAFYEIVDKLEDKSVSEEDMGSFKGFIRNILMHSGIGTALGGVSTMVGEPQNLIIAAKVEWGFAEFASNMLHVSFPVLIAGVLLCLFLECFKVKYFGFGYQMPASVRKVLNDYVEQQSNGRTREHKVKVIVQGVIAVLLVAGLAFHVAEVGLLGLAVIILAASFTGVTDEHDIGQAFTEALPFTALLAVFFTVVSVIVDQKLFAPILDMALTYSGESQMAFFFVANAVLSMVSDNVFVGSVYINEVKSLFDSGVISRLQFENLAIAINAGTNLPSIATPNGQAAFLFLLTSRIAIPVCLSYGSMVRMALPYTVTISFVAFIAMLSGVLTV